MKQIYFPLVQKYLKGIINMELKYVNKLKKNTKIILFQALKQEFFNFGKKSTEEKIDRYSKNKKIELIRNEK